MTDAELAALKEDMKRPDSAGNCFMVALILALSNPAAFLCHGVVTAHGVVTGNGGEMLGKQFWHWHAWIVPRRRVD